MTQRKANFTTGDSPSSSIASPRKRVISQDRDSDSKGTTPKKRRTSAKERSKNDPYEPKNNLVDALRPGLILVMIGLNPGLKTAETGQCRYSDPALHHELIRAGHAYAHPSNRFWHLLYESGITPKKHLPSETHDLQDLYSIGNTNICARPTRDGSGLSKDELREGALILEEKIRKLRPEAVCIVGKQIWETLWQARFGRKLEKDEFRWGWQEEAAWLGRVEDESGKKWAGTRTFVATSTSGLSASLRPAEKLAIWKPLGEWFTARRRELEGAERKEPGNDEGGD